MKKRADADTSHRLHKSEKNTAKTRAESSSWHINPDADMIGDILSAPDLTKP